MAAKMMIVIRKDLRMRRGKEVAQGAHAVEDIVRRIFSSPSEGSSEHVASWYGGGRKKVAVSVDSEAELESVYQQAASRGMPASIVTDAGLTEFNGVPTKTAVAIGPWDEDVIDLITGNLRLM